LALTKVNQILKTHIIALPLEMIEVS